MNSLQSYKYWITRQLPEIADATDRECVEECIATCYGAGFSKEDALAFVSLTEHVNPMLSEREACDRMAEIASLYRSPKLIAESKDNQPKPAILFDVKTLARCIKLTQKHREESYKSYKGDGHYQVSEEQAAMMAVKELNLPKELWQIVQSLLLCCWNDAGAWADSVLNDTFDQDYEVVEENEKSVKSMQPMQPIYIDEDQRPRFKANAIIKYLLDTKKVSLNDLMCLPVDNDERSQFLQLTGCSVCMFGEVSFTNKDDIAKADAEGERLLKRSKKS